MLTTNAFLQQKKHKMNSFTLREIEACGLYCFKEENYPQALSYFKQLAESKAASYQNYAHLGRVYAKLKLYDEAKEAYENFVFQSPQSYVELFQLGLVLFELGNFKLAVERWDQALDLENNFPPALYYKAVLCALEGDLKSSNFLLAQLIDIIDESNLYHDLANKQLAKNKTVLETASIN